MNHNIEERSYDVSELLQLELSLWEKVNNLIYNHILFDLKKQL